MDKTSLYIQKLIVLLLVFTTGVILHQVVKIYFLLPGLFFTLSFLISRITGEKPDFLFGVAAADDFLNKKAGFWLLFKWILVLFGLIYDFIAWTLYGVFVLFIIILDFILLIKTILFWIIHAIIWFFKQLVPPLVFIFKMKIHYIFRWSWWIYKMSFNNIRKSLNLNFYFISLWGAVLLLFVLLLFYGVGILLGLPEIAVLGAVFALLPLVWSYGEISSLRLRKAESESYQQTRKYFQSGFDAVKAVLNYFLLFLILALVEIVFNILGWIPQVGFSFMGLAINVNTMATLILLFIFVILVFAKLIMPPHVVYNKNFRADLDGSINFLGVIGRRFLRYIISAIPTSLFGLIVTLIPGLIVFLSVVITLNLKNSILDSRISVLNQRISVLEGLEKYEAQKDKERIVYYKNFPQNIISNFGGIKPLNGAIKHLKKNVLEGEKEMSSLRLEFSATIDSLDKRISGIKSRPMADSIGSRELVQLESMRKNRLDNFSKWEQEGVLSIDKMKVDLADKKNLMIQLPIVILLTIIWASFFVGLVLAFLVSYLGNVYFELYNFKEDENPSYFRKILSEMKTADRNQPLLGFTLIAFLIVALIFMSQIKSLVEFIADQFRWF